MWEKCAQYIKKIGTVILLSTVVIWFLSYYPRPDVEGKSGKVGTGISYQQAETMASEGINESSFIAMIGHAVEPVLAPLGQNWRSSIALITSIPAKELVVSTLGVLYSSDSEESIQEDLRSSGDFTPRSAAAFMVFILLFFPCIATVAAIAEETGNRWWAVFSIVYNTAAAWVAGYIVYIIGGLL
jgi:ferrous iron transport protein B